MEAEEANGDGEDAGIPRRAKPAELI